MDVINHSETQLMSNAVCYLPAGEHSLLKDVNTKEKRSDLRYLKGLLLVVTLVTSLSGVATLHHYLQCWRYQVTSL